MTKNIYSDRKNHVFVLSSSKSYWHFNVRYLRTHVFGGHLQLDYVVMFGCFRTFNIFRDTIQLNLENFSLLQSFPDLWSNAPWLRCMCLVMGSTQYLSVCEKMFLFVAELLLCLLQHFNCLCSLTIILALLYEVHDVVNPSAPSHLSVGSAQDGTPWPPDMMYPLIFLTIVFIMIIMKCLLGVVLTRLRTWRLVMAQITSQHGITRLPHWVMWLQPKLCCPV